MSAANAVRSQSASNTPTDSMTFTASAEPVWMESVRTTTRAAAAAALRRPPSSGRLVSILSVMRRVYSAPPPAAASAAIMQPRCIRGL